MPTRPRRLYWDSCVFIHALQQTPDLAPVLKVVITSAQSGDLVIVTSTFTLAEVIGRPRRSFTAADEKLVRELFENPYIVVRDLTRPIATEARRIVVEHGLKPPDAVHVATALDAGVAVFHTTDGHGGKRGLLDANGRIGSPPLTIEPPSFPTQPRLLCPTDEGCEES